MKKFVWILPLLFMVGGCASNRLVGDHSTVRGIQILDYGIYDQVKTGEPTTVRPTTRIPARLGTSFGFRYLVSGSPAGETAYLTFRDSFPGIRDPDTGDVLGTGEYTIPVKMGVANVCAYTFDERSELVPGEWTFTIWRGNRLLAEKTFTVVR